MTKTVTPRSVLVQLEQQYTKKSSAEYIARVLSSAAPRSMAFKIKQTRATFARTQLYLIEAKLPYKNWHDQSALLNEIVKSIYLFYVRHVNQ